MKFGTMCEIVSAVHLSRFVESPYEQRGGLMFVSPAGHLKTTAIEVIEDYENAIVLSNVTVKALNAMREDCLSGTIRTIGFSDLAQVYRRHGSVSANIEGVLMSLAEEGFRNPAFADQRIQANPARCAIIGGMTTTFFEQMQEGWLDNGFFRRFIWCRYVLHDSTILTDAISEWRKADLDGEYFYKFPTSKSIPWKLEEKEIGKVRHSLRFQRDLKTPLILALKIFAVLKWKFGKTHPEKPMEVWLDFAESLGKDGAIVYLKEEGRTKK